MANDARDFTNWEIANALGYTGEGIDVGIMDAQFVTNHSDFIDEAGNSKFDLTRGYNETYNLSEYVNYMLIIL